MRPARPSLAFAILALSVVACSTRRGQDGPERAPTILEVENRSNLDATIYVVEYSGVRTRLGNVIAHTTDWLRIPDRMMTVGIVPLQFQADPVGRSAQPISQTINVQRGDTVVMIVPVRQAGTSRQRSRRQRKRRLNGRIRDCVAGAQRPKRASSAARI